MSNKIERNIKLSDAVNMYIDEARLTTKDFRRLWAMAFRGLQEIGMDVSWSPKVTVLPVNLNLTADLPDDYLEWIRVGLFNASGEIATLKVNEQLTKYRDTTPTRLSDTTTQLGDNMTVPNYPYWFGYWDQDYEHYFGAGSGLIQAGECRLDSANRVVVFDPQFSYSSVVFEYVSSPMMDDDYTIDFRCQEALISYLRWKDIQSLPATKLVNISEKTMREREYYSQKKLARKRLKPFRLQVAEQYIREAATYGVKG
jgi:hypothetical protein